MMEVSSEDLQENGSIENNVGLIDGFRTVDGKNILTWKTQSSL
jgi:hypothetical protein